MGPKNLHDAAVRRVMNEGRDEFEDGVSLANALLLLTSDHDEVTAGERGRAAFLESRMLEPSQRRAELSDLLDAEEVENNPTLQSLRDMRDKAFQASSILAIVGYDRLRALHAEGALWADICVDLGVNLNDLFAFMRAHPDAELHAKEDDEACADAMTARLLNDLKGRQRPSAAQVDLLKITANVQMEMNKRLSGRWAQRTESGKEAGGAAGSQFNVYIGSQSGTPMRQIQPNQSTVIDQQPYPVQSLDAGDPLDQAPEPTEPADVIAEVTREGVSMSFGAEHARTLRAEKHDRESQNDGV